MAIEADADETKDSGDEIVQFDFYMMPGSETVFLHEPSNRCQGNFWCAVGPLVQALDVSHVPVAAKSHAERSRIAPLDWSDSKYKFTLGVGSIGLALMLSELRALALPVWAVVVITFLPFVVFLFLDPRDLPRNVVRVAQVAASAWYVIVASALIVATMTIGPIPRNWSVYLLFVLAGAIPCCLVLFRAVSGR